MSSSQRVQYYWTLNTRPKSDPFSKRMSYTIHFNLCSWSAFVFFWIIFVLAATAIQIDENIFPSTLIWPQPWMVSRVFPSTSLMLQISLWTCLDLHFWRSSDCLILRVGLNLSLWFVLILTSTPADDVDIITDELLSTPSLSCDLPSFMCTVSPICGSSSNQQ